MIMNGRPQPNPNSIMGYSIIIYRFNDQKSVLSSWGNQYCFPSMKITRRTSMSNDKRIRIPFKNSTCIP